MNTTFDLIIDNDYILKYHVKQGTSQGVVTYDKVLATTSYEGDPFWYHLPEIVRTTF